MKRNYLGGACALLVAVLMFTSCKGGPVAVATPPASASESQSEPQTEPTQEETEPTEPTDELDEPTEPVVEITLYLYRAEGDTYHPIPVPGSDRSIEALADMVALELDLPTPQMEVTHIKGMIILDFDGTYIDEVLSDPDLEEVFLNSLCVSVAENAEEVQWFNLRRDGAGYKSKTREMELEEEYEYPPLKIGGGTAEEYTAVRGQVPYPGLNDDDLQYLRTDLIPTDETGEELLRYLFRIGEPETEADSPADLPDSFVLLRALRNINWYTTLNYGQPELTVYELRPITAAVEDDTIALREHVEAAVRELFGDVSYEHQTISAWQWHPVEGVYTPPHMGGGYADQPAIFSYEEEDGRYTVEVAFATEGLGSFVDGNGDPIAEDALDDYIRNKLPRWEIVLQRNADGDLVLQSCHKK